MSRGQRRAGDEAVSLPVYSAYLCDKRVEHHARLFDQVRAMLLLFLERANALVEALVWVRIGDA